MASTGVFEQRRRRIINHMNNGHQQELTHYLQHFACVPHNIASASPELRDISLERMIIRVSGNHEYTVPFAPPLSSWEEIRSRSVEMDATARASIYDITITEYASPKGFGAFVFSLVSFYFACYISLPWVVPGSTAWNILETVFPGGPAWFRFIVKMIFWPVVAIHTSEAVVFDRTRMKRHGVQRWSNLWWKWEANCWIEGITAWKRIDAIIATKRAEKGYKQE